jgi:type IX secretion system PorP/SprF family membrane protein
MGLGAYLFNDKLGPIQHTGISLSYSYHIKTGENSLLSLGLGGLFNSVRLDNDKLSFDAEGNSDKVISTNNFSTYYPNFSFGALFKTQTFYSGISVPELLKTKIAFTKDYYLLREVHHAFWLTGYKIGVNDDLLIEPSVLLKYANGAPISVDVNAKAVSHNKVTFGLSYRHKDAIVLLAGFTFTEGFNVGYSYDMTLSAIKTYSSGSHELMLGYNFKRKNKNRSKL